MILLSSKYEKLAKLLHLDKPLLIFDITATGTGISSDKIIHLALIKIWPDGRIKKDEFYFNPEFRISAESMAVHGIRNRFLKDKPTFRQKAQEIWELFNDCFYGGFNVKNFDLPILRREFIRVGMDFDYSDDRIIDSRSIFHYMAPRTVPMAYEYYLGKECKCEYNAALHADLTADILLKQLEKYKEARSLDFIKMIHESDENAQSGTSRKFYWIDGETYFAFSKYKDQSVASIAKKDKTFLLWILEADFSDDIKGIVRQAMGEEVKNGSNDAK